MQSEAIDAVDFREAQHKHWDSAAVGWKQWSEFNDSADGHISERLVELAGVRPGSSTPARPRKMFGTRSRGRSGCARWLELSFSNVVLLASATA